MWHQNVASLAYVREAGGIPRCGVKTWRHLPTWRQGARWRRRTWRQNVASRAHMSSGRRCGVKTWSHLLTWRSSLELCQGSCHWPTWGERTWRQNVSRGVREPRGIAVASPDVASERGVRRPTCAPPQATPLCIYIYIYIYYMLLSRLRDRALSRHENACNK